MECQKGTRETMPQFVGFDPGAGIAGVFQSQMPGPPAVAYIYVPEVAPARSRIEQAGGSRPADAMSFPGRECFGAFKDPSGTDMGLIGPA